MGQAASISGRMPDRRHAKLDHCHSSARETKLARKALRSTYRNTASRCQQAIAEDAHRNALVRQGDQLDERRKLAVFVKHIAPRIAAVQHVVADATYGSSSGSWHAAKNSTAAHTTQDKSRTSLFHCFFAFRPRNSARIEVSRSASSASKPRGTGR